MKCAPTATAQLNPSTILGAEPGPAGSHHVAAGEHAAVNRVVVRNHPASSLNTRINLQLSGRFDHLDAKRTRCLSKYDAPTPATNSPCAASKCALVHTPPLFGSTSKPEAFASEFCGSILVEARMM